MYMVTIFRWISVKEDASVAIVDLHHGNALSRKPMKAEATLMNPKDNVIALRARTDGTAGHLVQVKLHSDRL